MFPHAETNVKSYLVPFWKVTPGNVTFRERVRPAGTILLLLQDVEAVPIIPPP